ncbi:RNase H-like domain-containing protein, partial [Bacteroides uniformis]|uniref:RNase H-like domain-containing protein n=1 Tax=Bacteroides uniformis TaxID=820 RepID=UPI001AA0C774|nr:hypothetical protein [Bacteroides uniformis]
TVLTQKDGSNDEQPISFMSARLQGADLNYLDIEKQAYAICKEIKHFKPYILKNHITMFVLHRIVCSLFVQQ